MKKRKLGRKLLSFLLTLAILVGLMPGMGLAAYAAPTETLLTTITATGKEQANYSTEGVATVSFSYSSGGSSAYLANWGWWGYGWTATVTPADGYTITKCVFYDDANRKATDSEAPFVVETTEEDKTPQVNGTPILAYTSKGIKKIEVYGYATPAAALDPVSYMAWNGTTLVEKTGDDACTDYTVVTADTATFEDGKWYVVSNSVTVSSRITVTGTVNLILCDGATLTASKGITVNSGNTINIYAQIGGTGELNAGSDTNVASIGGGERGASSGTVNIHGGKITATGGTNASGIGGALEGGNGEVNIYSGEVTARGKNYAAGIGGYSGKSGGTVNIYGGIVNASGSQYGTTGIGIGGIKPGSCVVHIYGGEVTATSEKAAAGMQGTITIDGGTVTANGGVSDGIDDSSGETYSSNGINGTITINSGTVTATGGNVTANGYMGAIESYGGAIYACSGINGTVTISGGTVTATGGNVTGDINNYGGTIYACNGVNGTVTISGGTVTATGGSHTGNSSGTTVKEKGFGGSLTLGTGMYLYGGTSANPESNLSNYRSGAGDYTGDRYVYMTVNNVVPHIHSFTYTATGATITAACTAGCDITEGLALTISAPAELTYDGSAKAASLSTGYNTTAFPDEYTIKYYQGASEVEAANVKAAGDYTAKVTVDDATASVDFTIAKAETTIATPPTAGAIIYGQTLADSTLTGGEASKEGRFEWKDSTVAPAVSDSQTTEYDVVFTPTDGNYGTAECKVKLTVNKADSSVTKVPVAKALTYNGKAQKLVTAGTATGGEMQYALGDANGATQPYTTDIPAKTDAGPYYVWYKVKADENHNDTDANYVEVSIGKRSVTLTSATASKVYDGTALTNTDVTVGGDGFATGEGATYNVTGTQTLPGNSKNTFDYALKTGTSAGNYKITKTEGTLTVTDRTDEEGDDKKYEITVTANSDEVTYDGTEKSVSGFVQTAFTFNGVTYTVSGLTATAKGTDAGSYTAEVTGTAVVKDANDNDLTNQFVVSTSNGTLTINKRNVTLTSATASKTYDGNALTDNTVTTSGDGFATGEGATYNVTGSQKVVGSSANAFTYTLNSGTKEANYNITKTEGTLTVTSRDAKYQISPQANSDEVKYDGQSHEVTGFETDTFTVEGNTYTVSGLTAAGSGTDAGSYTVSVSGAAVVKDSDGNDVSDEFAVTPQTGTLTINKRSVTLTSASDEKEYDGDALTNDEVTVTGDGFVTGEGATYDVTGTRTLVGSSENAFTYTLNEGTKADNYDITPSYGTLTVTNRNTKYEVTLKANSGTEKYDGSEKTVSGYTIDGTAGEGTGESVVTSFTASNGKTYTVTGMSAEVTGTNAGEYAVNVIGTPIVKDADGNDVTTQFAVSSESGKLTIDKRSVTLTSATDTKVYDGKALSNDEITVSEDGFVTGEGVNYNVTGTQTLPGNSKNTFDYTLKTGTTAGNYEITKTEGTLTVTDRTDEEGDDKKYEITITANSDEVTYDGTEKSVSGFVQTAFTFNGVTYTVSGLSATAKGTDAGSYTAEVTGTAVVKDANGNNLTNQFIVSTSNGTLTINKRNVTLTSATASKTYDGNALTDNTVTTSGDGFATGEGVTYNVTGSQKVVGSSANAFTYTLNSGTKGANYNITKTEGTLTVTSRDAKYQISPQANSDELKYDGQSHEVTGFETDTFTVEGNTYTVSGLTAAGSGTDAGSYIVSVSGTAVVKDSDGTDVSDQFSVTPQTGTLTINKRSVTLTSASDEKEYDGDALTNDEVTVTGDGFVTGEGANYDVTGTRTLVGSSENAFTYTLNEGTKADNYDITPSFGTLTVTNRNTKYEVTLKANSGTEKYDGNEKTVSGYTIDGNAGEGTGESVVTSFTASNGKTYTVTGMSAEVTGTNAGEYAVNVIGTPIVKDADGNDVTAQFAVSSESGKLTIDKRRVTLTSVTDTKVYDGKALSNDEITVTEDGFAEGEGATYDVTGSQTLAGESANAFTYSLNEGTIADNYDITTVEGKLTVTKSDSSGEVTAVSGLVYDGKAKALVTAGKTEGGTLMYRLGTDGKWQQDIPEATDAGTYKIYYYIKGDDNHKDDGSEKEPKGSVETTIKKAAQDKPAETFAVAEASDDKTADGKISGFDKTKTYQYSADDGKTWTNVKAGSTEIAVKSGTYQIRYAEDKNHEAGKAASVTVTAKAAPEPVKKDATINLKSVTQKNNKVQVSWTKVNEADGYDVYVHYCGSKAKKPVKTIKKNTTTKTSVAKINGKKINQKKNFRVKVVAYKMVDGKKVTLAKTITGHLAGAKSVKYTNPKALKLTKSTYNIKVKKTAKIKAKVTLENSKKKLLPKSHAAKLRYKSSNTKIATVNKNGKITGKSKGTCYIYVYTINGLMKKVKVTVK